MAIHKFFTEKKIFIISLLFAIYIGVLYMNSTIWQFDFTLLTVIQELITLPIIILQIFLFGYVLLSIFNRSLQFENMECIINNFIGHD